MSGSSDNIDCANDIFDLLVSIGGAPESLRPDFLHRFPTDEYRFQGHFGFGGKLYHWVGRGGELFEVGYYGEARTPELDALEARINVALLVVSRDQRGASGDSRPVSTPGVDGWPIAKPCRSGATHEEHTWSYRSVVDDAIARYGVAPKRIDPDQVYACPGVEHADHDERCCAAHGTHAKNIHIGCVLR